MIGRDEDKLKKVAQQVDQFFNMKMSNSALSLINYVVADIAEVK